MDAQKVKQITDAALAVGNILELTSPQTVTEVEIAKIGMAALINYLAIAGLSADQIETVFKSEYTKFLADDPNNIKIPG